MIDLGLKRISQLLPNISTLPWRAIHVAGTNGKGSICAYLTSILHSASIPVGRFTSPHLIHPHDSITINNAPVPQHLYNLASSTIRSRNESLRIGATEFEILTATAFECFTLAHVAVGVVEVGLGGRLDATNVLRKKIACVVAKVDLDHQAFLGETLRDIAAEKAGIAVEGVRVVVDGGNPGEVLEAVEKVVERVGGEMVVPVVEVGKPGEGVKVTTEVFGTLRFTKMLPGRFQAANLACAVTALEEAVKRGHKITPEDVVTGVANTEWPGRLQTIDVRGITKIPGSRVLLDGAHNPGAAKELRAYIGDAENVVWVLAFSKGKNVDEMVGILIKENDTVVATEFGAVEDMPWVKPVDASEIAAAVEKVGVPGSVAENVKDALRRAFAEAQGRRVVVAGSLYMVGELLREMQ
ncbi:FolC bifunctional protein [Ascodesmis nigricans]|uniref:Dihydrofolate synthetase n=1 Tax=Ascodesmis nigricans TaxID=341454 RepID=A0A4S2N188_9PEZI|nr:FolC bifunctional protein [Ascodesmis nigricans]